ncbi:hypothetical protein L0U89_15300 [Mariniradius sp. RY-2]|uniref:Uncharacterized protein n=1 Tax=Mariniradius sediminis TaxID=2909237 RepID=A0ABS9BWH8_9BACT|nr:hypothetical protein [Mariniradius sediminis]
MGYFGIASKHLGKFEGQENKPQNGINQIFDLGVNPLSNWLKAAIVGQQKEYEKNCFK